MGSLNLNGSALGSQLQEILMSDAIVPGSEPSYQLVKIIYLWHPMGAKMVERPVKIAQSQKRKISIPNAPEEAVREQFEREWKALNSDAHIAGAMYQARIYGVGSLILGARNVPPDQPIDPFTLPDRDLYFNVLDALNTAGSLVLNQDPNSPDFQKPTAIAVSGQVYHPSRSCVVFNEQPVYIAYTSSGFGYVGRSVYQRALFPLKSFIQSMITDDMVSLKAGLLIAKMKSPSSIVNQIWEKAASIKRSLLKEGQTNNVLSIDTTEDIETLNMQNTDTAMTTARKNIIENIATAADMPAKLLLQESFAEGFGEGSEDAKHIVQYINGLREEMSALYKFFDTICMHRAWSKEFYATIQAQYPDEYGDKDYLTAFYEWRNCFRAEWPSLIEEPESEQSKTEKVKLEGITAMLEILLPQMDPENKARAVEWAMNNVNEMKLLFANALTLDIEALAEWEPPVPTEQDNDKDAATPGKPKLAAAR